MAPAPEGEEEVVVEDPQAVLEDMAKFIITDLKRFVDTGVRVGGSIRPSKDLPRSPFG